MARETAYLNLPFPSSLEEPYEESMLGFFNNVDNNLFSAVTDRNLMITGGGTITFTTASSELTWTSPILLTNFVTGFFQQVIDPTTKTPPDPAVTLAPGEFLFVRQVRGLEDITGTIDLDPNTATKLLSSPRRELHTDTVLCFRYGDTIIWRNGAILLPNTPTPILIAPPPATPVFIYPTFLSTQWYNEDLVAAGAIGGVIPTTIKTGEYTGDGTNDRLITTGLLGDIRYVRVFRTDFTDQPVFKTDKMLGKQTKEAGGFVFNDIAFVGGDFTVDNLPVTNGLGFIYRWVAYGTP